MAVDVILGLQWGDEGKGKLVDLLADHYDCVVRYQGGDNAGHTVVRDGRKLKFHLIPSGISTPGKLAVIGNGVVIFLESLIAELDMLAELAVPIDNLRISDRAFIVLPGHRDEDRARESGDDAIGTTVRGIGPAYRDKVGRSGIRVGDFLEGDIERRLGLKGLSAEQVARQLELFDRIRPFVCDTVVLLNRLHGQGREILLEGAQGVMLDVDFGTYPYVTSSSPSTGGGCLGTGLPPQAVRRVIGVMKAYTTRVGKGPFPTELTNAMGDRLREQGQEYGTTTGRPRRCGWLDFVQLRYAAQICGVTDVAVMKLDVLTGLGELRAALGYRHDGRPVEGYPSRASVLERVEVDYETLPGWTAPIVGASSLERLPPEARAYLKYIEQRLERPIRHVSTSPDRVDTITVS